jgi:hypothetical protein
MPNIFNTEFIPRFTNNEYETNALAWSSGLAQTTNIQLGNVVQNIAGFGTNLLGSVTGIPQVAQVGNSLLELGNNYSVKNQYAVAELRSNRDQPGVAYPDFRSRKGYIPPLVRVDGASAALRGSVIAAMYAAASATPFGPYSVFNLDGVGKTGYGLGDHDNPYAFRNDFTTVSHVATRWKKGIGVDANGDPNPGSWGTTFNPLEMATPFRGDKVNVIDFGKRTRKAIYQWKRSGLGAALGLDLLDIFNTTQDFIKFYLTGPKLANGAPESIPDDVIVFRAIITGLSDTFSPNWTPVTMIGRADQNYHYTGYARDLQVDFTVYASDRDEMKFIYRKLNALAGYTAPEYDLESIAMKAPWLRITIGDLFLHQPVIITSLSYTLQDSDTTWEINIEQDPEMMQAPHKISVSLGLTPIMDYLPQKGGRMYSLADEKEFDRFAQPKPGNRNWLSDSLSNPTIPLTPEEVRVEAAIKAEEKSKSKTTFKNKDAKEVTKTTGLSRASF